MNAKQRQFFKAMRSYPTDTYIMPEDINRHLEPWGEEARQVWRAFMDSGEWVLIPCVRMNTKDDWRGAMDLTHATFARDTLGWQADFMALRRPDYTRIRITNAISKTWSKIGKGLRAFAGLPIVRHLLLALVVLSKMAAKGKTLLSMAFMIAVYTWTWGLPFAFGMVIMIYLHEMGHVYVIRRYGIKATAPIFIPFVGALIGMKEMPKKAWDEAMVGFGGPLGGGLASFATMGMAMYFHSQILQCIAYVGFILNLFNMLPMRPMDGGRIIQAVSPWIHVLGCVAGLGLTFVIKSPILGIMTFLGFAEIFPLFRMERQKDVAPWHRVVVGIAYLVTIAALMYGAEATFLPDSAIKTLQGR